MSTDELTTRRQTLERIKKEGIDPYPAKSARDHEIGIVLQKFSALQDAKKNLVIAGRIRAIRTHGGVTFLRVEDGTGAIQSVLKKDELGEKKYAWFLENLNIGDFVEVAGVPFTTARGEKSIAAERLGILTKSLAPLPEQWHGLSDVEVRYRRRELDLIANPEVRGIFETRAALVREIRSFFDARGYTEVETPILQDIPGGANARPFKTHHNALGADLYLRVAPELYLKKLLIGGMDRVYEFARCFRNEGIDHLHNPEFTQIEAYESYGTYETYMALFEELLPRLCQAVGLDPRKVPYGKDVLNFTAPFRRITFSDALKEFKAPKTGTLEERYKASVRPNIVNPTFITDWPVELKPLAKRCIGNPDLTETFQILCARGFELVNAFSELNDPLDQEARFKEQEKARRAGDEEAQRGDPSFVEALKVGMPPAVGLGMGIDRLTMLLTNSHGIKEVIAFPTLKPEKQ